MSDSKTDGDEATAESVGIGQLILVFAVNMLDKYIAMR